MSNSPLHLRLARQILGEDLEEAQNASPKNSPFIDYKPPTTVLQSRVLPDDQATNLKTSTLSHSGGTI